MIYQDCVTFAQSRSRINPGEYPIKGGEFTQNVSAHIENALVKAMER
jgi:hypothetical protein